MLPTSVLLPQKDQEAGRQATQPRRWGRLLSFKIKQTTSKHPLLTSKSLAQDEFPLSSVLFPHWLHSPVQQMTKPWNLVFGTITKVDSKFLFYSSPSGKNILLIFIG
jgi:hypothetical protein